MRLNGKVSYMLRRTPREWMMHTDEDIKEAVAYCRENGIDEVVWFVESAAALHSFVRTEQLSITVEWLARAGRILKKHNILSSVNVLYTFGHGEYGNVMPDIFSRGDFMVDITGYQSAECLCPLAPSWQKWAADFYRQLASARPARIWIDDDFRFTGHGRVRYGCFCPRHLKRFSDFSGIKLLSRKKLAESLLKPDKPHPLRNRWLDFQNTILLESSGIIRDAVHSAAPNTRVALMTTTPFLWEIEGRKLPELLQTFSSPHEPTVRLCTSGYQEKNLRDFYIVDESLKRVRTDIPKNTVLCSEIESMPYSLYSKSCAWISAQMEWATVLNVPHHTLNLYDRMGSPLAEEPSIGTALKDLKPRLTAINERFQTADFFRGIYILRHNRTAHFVRTRKGESFTELLSHDMGWTDALRCFGFPVQFENMNESVIAVTGQSLRAYEDKLEDIFKKGVLLDLSALETLLDMGRGDILDVKIEQIINNKENSLPVSCEVLTGPDFGGATDKRTFFQNASVSGRFGVLKGGKNHRIISYLENSERERVFPAVRLAESKYGGRLCIYPYEFINYENPDMYCKGTSAYFYSPNRRKQMQAVIRWLAGDRVPLEVSAPGWILPHRADGEGIIALAVMNVNHDPWRQVAVRAFIGDRQINRVLLLTETNKWKTVAKNDWQMEKNHIEIEFSGIVNPLHTLAMLLEAS